MSSDTIAGRAYEDFDDGREDWGVGGSASSAGKRAGGIAKYGYNNKGGGTGCGRALEEGRADTERT